MLVPVAFLLRKAPEEASSPSGAGGGPGGRDLTAAQMLREARFWKFYLYSVLTCAVGSTVISFARDLAIHVGATVGLATTLVGVLSLCNGAGRILFGLIYDAIGRKRTMLLSNLLTIVAPALVLLSIETSALPLSILGFCMTGIAYGSSPTITAAVTGELYGYRYYPQNYGAANTMVIPASLMSTVAGQILALTGNAYEIVFLLLLLLPVLALFLNRSVQAG